MKLAQETQQFCQRLGYEFARGELITEALTHASVSSATRPDNQRLEFLGDRVLGLVIASELMAKNTAANEGELARHFNALVRKESCAVVAEKLDLGSVLRLGRSEMLTGGRRKKAMLGDAIEAVLAAVFLDGGYAAARKVVLTHWAPLLANVDKVEQDAKTRLQEWAQARGMPPPDYVDIAREGPDHAPQFHVEAKLQDGQSARAAAPSKRAAQQAAAAILIKELFK